MAVNAVSSFSDMNTNKQGMIAQLKQSLSLLSADTKGKNRPTQSLGKDMHAWLQHLEKPSSFHSLQSITETANKSIAMIDNVLNTHPDFISDTLEELRDSRYVEKDKAKAYIAGQHHTVQMQAITSFSARLLPPQQSGSVNRSQVDTFVATLLSVLEPEQVEDEIKALLSKAFLSDEDILLILALLGDAGFSISPALLDQISDRLVDWIESEAKNASSPMQQLALLDIIQQLSDSILGDRIDEAALLTLLNGDGRMAMPQQDDDNVTEVDSVADMALAASVDANRLADVQQPLSVDPAAKMAHDALRFNQQAAPKTLDVDALNLKAPTTSTHVESMLSTSFTDQFKQSMIQFMVDFVEFELENRIEGFA